MSSTLDVTGSLNLCTGDSVVLDAKSGYSSYKWSSGETTQSIVVKTAGEYSVAVQDAGGCKGNSNKVTVTVSPRPDPNITGQNSTCVNGNPLQYSVTPIAINSYTWVVSPEGTITNGQGSSSITVNWTAAGAGSVKVTESSANCSTDNTMAVTISSSLSPTITAIGSETKLSKIGKSLENIVEEKTPLEKQINRFVRNMAIVGSLVFVIVWFINFKETKDVLNSLLQALTLAMSILPEEIPVAFTTFMALGAWRLMKM